MRQSTKKSFAERILIGGCGFTAAGPIEIRCRQIANQAIRRGLTDTPYVRRALIFPTRGGLEYRLENGFDYCPGRAQNAWRLA